MSKGRAGVVGGGVVGAACAYYLSRAGWDVVVIERDKMGRGCSHGNCGLVCPSHVLPLTEPGAVWQGFKAQFQKNSPLRIRFRFNWAYWRWLWRFARRCNHADMLVAAHAKHLLLQSSIKLYHELMAQEPFDCEWEPRGLLYVFQTDQAMEAYSATDRLLTQEFQIPARRIHAGQLQQMEPALKPGLAGGWLYEEDCHLRPDKLMTSWRHVLDQHGVQVRENCDFTGLKRNGSRATSMATSQGEMAVDAVVVATGAVTPLLQHHLGCRIPIQPGKGYSLTMPRPARCPRLPLIFPEHRVVVTPMQSGYRLGSTMELGGYESTIEPDRLNLLKSAATHYLHEPYGEPVEEEWCGFRPMTFDDQPIIGPVPGMENVYLATGHGMLGVTLAPVTGKLVAEMLGGERPHVDVDAFRLR